jgi:hypothetical protein
MHFRCCLGVGLGVCDSLSLVLGGRLPCVQHGLDGSIDGGRCAEVHDPDTPSPHWRDNPGQVSLVVGCNLDPDIINVDGVGRQSGPDIIDRHPVVSRAPLPGSVPDLFLQRPPAAFKL